MESTKKLELHFWRNRPELPGAAKRLISGKEHASKQQYEEALELFRDAAKVDPYGPDAHYQAGMVLCEQKLYAQAIEEWERCEALAPGWYFCRSDLWIARRLALGTIPHEVFLGLRFLQDGPSDPKEKMKIATQMRFQANAVPLFALLYGELLDQRGQQKEAVEVWQEVLHGDVDSDVQTRLLVSLSLLEKNKEHKRVLLQRAVELNGNLVAAASAAFSLKMKP